MHKTGKICQNVSVLESLERYLRSVGVGHGIYMYVAENNSAS